MLYDFIMPGTLHLSHPNWRSFLCQTCCRPDPLLWNFGQRIQEPPGMDRDIGSNTHRDKDISINTYHKWYLQSISHHILHKYLINTSKITQINTHQFALIGWFIPQIHLCLLPWKLTCPLKIDGWKMHSLLKWSLFRGHVSFQGCILFISFHFWYESYTQAPRCQRYLLITPQATRETLLEFLSPKSCFVMPS